MGAEKMKHTEGLLKFDNAPGCKSIKGGKFGTHKQAQYKEIAFTVGLSDEAEDEANARRLVACWNACDGVSTEELERTRNVGDIIEFNAKGAHEQAAIEVQALQIQRDQLLEVLKAMLAKAERETCHHEETERRGAIWEVCMHCGRKWADDRAEIVTGNVIG